MINFTWLVVFMFLFGMFAVGQNMYQADTQIGYTQNISNISVILNDLVVSESAPNGLGLEKIESVGRIIKSFTLFIKTLVIEVTSMGIEYGYTHPEYNFISFLKFFTIAVLLLGLFSVLTPLFAFVYLIYIGFVKIKEVLVRQYDKIKKPGTNSGGIKNG